MKRQFRRGRRRAIHAARVVGDGIVPRDLAERRQYLRHPRRGQAPTARLRAEIRPAEHSYVSTPHTSTSLDPVHWKDPNTFDPQRYLRVPTSAQINDDKCRQIGLARCPFDITNFDVKDGRKANITNSGFGTVFAVVDGTGHPVCDDAGFAPFAFGYRRCPGEQLTIQVFEDFLRKVGADKIVFRKLNLANLARRGQSDRTP